MSRTSWKPRRVLGSAALACTLLITSAVPALGAVSLSPAVQPTLTRSITLAPITPAVASAVAQRVLTATTPRIHGTAKVGQAMTAIVGKWTTGTAFTYQWYRSGKAIAGARGKTYTATAYDRGKTLTVKVTGSKSGFATRSATSAKTKAVAAGTLTPSVPRVSGSAKAGKRLAVNRGSWTSGTKLTQRWYRNGAAISGATATSYTLKSADAGKTISVRVTGIKAGYTTVTKASAGIRVQAASKPAAKPKPSGAARPSGTYNCPRTHPIKGNKNSMIYHVPGGGSYAVTKPEQCFATSAAARAAGYRAARN